MSTDHESKDTDATPEDATPEDSTPKEPESKSMGDAFRELIEPFKALGQTSRSLFGIYFTYLIEGLVYFGVLTILGKYLSENVGLKDLHAGWVYSLVTGGITLSMLFLGGVSDKIGIRKALLYALGLLTVARLFLAASGTFFAQGGGAGSAMFVMVSMGLFFIVLGYGMYQPASYAAVKQFTNEKQATMAYAMIYGLMNLGAFFSGLLSANLRQRMGIESVYWAYFGLMVVAVLALVFIMTRKAVKKDTVTDINAKKPADERSEGEEDEPETEAPLAKLFTPAFTALVVGIAVSVVAVIALAITADPGPAAEPLDRVKAQYSKVAATVGLEEKQQTPAGLKKAKLRSTLGKHHAKLVALEAKLVPPTSLPDGTRVDRRTFEVLRLQVAAEARLVKALTKTEDGRLLATVKVGGATAKASYKRLRELGVHYMAVAYRLVGQFDRRVLRRIQQRQSLPSEDRIPVSDAVEARIMGSAAKKLPAMFAELVFATQQMSARMKRDFGKGGDTLSAVLSAEAGALAAILAKGDAAWPASLKGLMVQRCYLFGTLLIKNVAPKLIDAKKAKAKKIALAVVEARMASNAGYIEHMKVAADDAVQVPLGHRLKGWGLRYGLVLFVMLFFSIFAIVIMLRKRPEHPFHDGRFVFFIFVLIPVQTLFAHNWLTLPYYIDRAFGGTYVGANFEFFSNINPLLIFILTPFVAALTARRKVYNMMIVGTFVMAAPTFLLMIPPNPATLITYIVLMSIGEAMWQPRFLQWVAEIAPEGQTGAYMGIAQFPWFLTKVVTGLYSGYFLAKYCPLVGPQSTETMWLIYAIIAMASPVALVAAKRWMSAGMREKASA